MCDGQAMAMTIFLLFYSLDFPLLGLDERWIAVDLNFVTLRRRRENNADMVNSFDLIRDWPLGR